MRHIFVFLGITIVLLVVGLVIAGGAAFVLPDSTFARWQSWGTPPGGAAQIARVDASASGKAQVIVLNGEGAAFICCAQEIGNWTATKASAPRPNDDCALYNYKVDAPAFQNLQGQIVDCAVGNVTGGWNVDANLYVVLQDGSVAFGNYTGGFSRFFSLMLWTSCILVLLGWVVLGIFLRRRGRTVPSQ